MNSRRAKKDPRVREGSKLIGFRLVQDEWPKDPLTGFGHWLYIQALTQNRQLAADLLEHDAFTDIEFNPSKSSYCQARSAAMYVSLVFRQTRSSPK